MVVEAWRPPMTEGSLLRSFQLSDFIRVFQHPWDDRPRGWLSNCAPQPSGGSQDPCRASGRLTPFPQ